MNINFTQKLYKFDGVVLLEIEVNEKGEPRAGKDLTLHSVTILALLDTYPDEKNLPAEKKLARGELASKVFNSDSNGIDLSVEEITLIKKLVAKRFGALIVWQTESLFEGKEPRIKPKPAIE